MENITNYQIVSVLLSGPYNKTFDYLVEKTKQAKVGQIVIVPFGKQELLGLIFERSKNKIKKEKLKKIKSIVNLPLISKPFLDFTEFFASWNCAYKGNVLKLMVSPFDKKSIQNLDYKNYKPIDEEKTNVKGNFKKLNLYQKKASKEILNGFNKNSNCFLLDGVAGSGKTETYFEGVNHCLKNNKQVLILLPEIGLTSDWEERFKKTFGFKPLVWHSGITKSKKKKIWLSSLYNKKLVLVGARSALFLPFNNLGLIVVDEEHDLSFKQEEGIRYHARDMAIYLASKINIPIILSSATPSVETIFNVKLKKFSSLYLPSRATGSDLPEIQIIDMKENPTSSGNWLSDVMLKELLKRYKNNEQSLIFLNRRGYSPLTLCKNCGHRVQCNNCNSWLVEHKKEKIYLCHYCGYKKNVTGDCEGCNEAQLVSCGPGVEKIIEELSNCFPNAVIENFSSDTINKLDHFTESLKKIKSGKVDFIVGTQIIAKGYDIPNLNFVGIVDGDIGTYGGDLRSSEKCFQLLTQVSGRAGRHLKKKRGLVYLQTYNPESLVLKTIKEMNKDKFYEEELNFRKQASMPPFSRLISLIISSKYEKTLNEFSYNLFECAPKYKDVDILGPAPAPLNFVRGRYRNRFLVRSNKKIYLQNIVRDWISSIKIPRSIRLSIDVDPYNFM